HRLYSDQRAAVSAATRGADELARRAEPRVPIARLALVERKIALDERTPFEFVRVRRLEIERRVDVARQLENDTAAARANADRMRRAVLVDDADRDLARARRR